jgi:F0F1-type ATP synthase membrane subunit c/vacuolar-type H+-ATPase subunit K
MVLPTETLTAVLTQPQALQTVAKGLILGGGFIGPGIGIGVVGGSYLQAAGRNPSAARFLLGQALVFVALVELFGLLAFASIFIVV